ncbi:MAG: metal-dependent hydrolase [Planctomycetota bacterium]|jgi:inner membrane protein
MDPLTQTLLGSAAAQAVMNRKIGPAAALMGAVGGALPDIDVFVTWADPALPIAFHRHFTHALVFVPVAGALAALPFLAAARWRRQWTLVFLATTIGAATHALLDVCTSYGTYLLWPLVDRRLALDVISIIDPVFTAALLIGVVWAVIARSGRPAVVGLAVCLAYLGLGVVQHERAEAAQRRLAAGRQHEIARGRVMPTLGNLIVWRSVYETQGRLHADAVRAPLFGAAAVREGESVALVRLGDLPPEVLAPPRVRRVVEGFRDFADGYVARVPGDPDVMGDMRYSMVTSGFDPLWGIRLEAGPPEPTVRWVHLAGNREGAVRDLWRDVTDPGGYN